jgi:hypothetical protein
MISPVDSSAPMPAVAQPTATQAPAPATPASSVQDTVQISNGAKALLQEAMETSAQTSREASAGDAQAIRLLAKQAAARASAK